MLTFGVLNLTFNVLAIHTFANTGYISKGAGLI